MDIQPDLIKWLREMGYNGLVPDNLIGICNNSTKFIWEQLMQNIRPKHEVEVARRNIILNRLKIKPLHKQDDFVYKVKEIEEYKKKIAVAEKLKIMNEMVKEKQYKVDQISQKCKMEDVSLDFLKAKIKENEQRKYLLDAKKEQLELQNLQAEESLTKLKNVTPVEREESNTAKEITEILEKCADKLNKLLKENQKSIGQKIHKNAGSFTVIKKINPHDQSSVANYLSIQEKEDFEEITRSCKKDTIANKEKIKLNRLQEGNTNVKHRLFSTPQIIIEDTEKNSFETLGVATLSFDGSNNSGNCAFAKIPNKRESLGLLPDSCLDEIYNNDSFLQSIGNTSDRFDSESVFNKSQDSVFFSEANTFQKSNNSDDSVAFNFKIPEMKPPAKKSTKLGDGIKTELYRDMAVNRELEKLLHGNNREFIYETLQKCINNIKIDFTKIVSMENGVDERKKKINEDDIAKLRFVHVQTELKILQQKKVLKELVGKVGRKKMQILSAIDCKENLSELQEWLDLSMKQVALDASLASMKKEINSSKVVENDDNDLQVLSSRIMKIKSEIANKMHLIQLTIDDLYATQKYIAATKESVLSPIWHIRMFKTDSDWMNPLLEDAWSEEMHVFENYPLEYTRRCIYTDPKIFYRDLCTDNYPQNNKIGSDDLQMLSEILESPFSPPETILLNVIKAKIKMNVLTSIRNNRNQNVFGAPQHSKKYSFEELHQQESYLEFAIDRLKSLMCSSNAGRTLSIGEVVKQAMDIWTDMPMKDFISDKRLFEGQNYHFYQNKLNSFL